MVAKSADAMCDMFEIALYNAIVATIAAIETDECAEMIGSPAIVQILAAFDIILITFPTVGVDDIESGLANFQHVRLGDFVNTERKDSFAILRIVAVFVNDDGVFRGWSADEPDLFCDFVARLVDGSDGD